MLQFRVFANLHSRRSPHSFLGLTPIPCPLSPNSHGIISFADPHLLTPTASIFCKNSGGEGGLDHSGTGLSQAITKSFKCNTYGPADKCCKQKAYEKTKSFSCNTYKKRGEGAVMVN